MNNTLLNTSEDALIRMVITGDQQSFAQLSNRYAANLMNVARPASWYGVEIILKTEAPFFWSYTGEFNNQSLISVLESLSFSQNFHYIINGKSVQSNSIMIDYQTKRGIILNMGMN